MQRLSLTLLGWLFLAPATASAGDVTVKGVHLCCPSCVAGVQEALAGIDGISDLAADRDSKLVTFNAADASAAQAGIDALAAGGFHGTAEHAGKPLKFPASGAKPNTTADAVTLSGVHLCCTACVTAAHKSLSELDGVSIIEIDRKEGVITLSGSEINVAAAVKALNDGGFHASVK